jgi:hypothetical protein
MRPPGFVLLFPGAQVVQSGRLVSDAAPTGVGFLDLAARGSAEDVRDFYIAHLRAAGFEARELDMPGLNPMTAAYLELAGSVSSKRPATDDVVTVQIRTEDGIFLPSGLL